MNRLFNHIRKRTGMMGKLAFSCFILSSSLFVLSSCNDWLDVKPNNEQVTDDYWQSKEDVEAVISSGYYYMRTCVPYYIKWGDRKSVV